MDACWQVRLARAVLPISRASLWAGHRLPGADSTLKSQVTQPASGQVQEWDGLPSSPQSLPHPSQELWGVDNTPPRVPSYSSNFPFYDFNTIFPIRMRTLVPA